MRTLEETVVVVTGGADVVVVVGAVLGGVVTVEVAVVGGGEELAVVVVDGAEEVPDDELASEPKVSFAGVELKLSTPAKPATVPIMTSGARFIVTLFLSWIGGLTCCSSEGEDFLVDSLVSRTKAHDRFGDGLVKVRRSADVDIGVVDMSYELLQLACVHPHFVSRANELEETSVSLIDQLEELLTVDDVIV